MAAIRKAIYFSRPFTNFILGTQIDQSHEAILGIDQWQNMVYFKLWLAYKGGKGRLASGKRHWSPLRSFDLQIVKSRPGHIDERPGHTFAKARPKLDFEKLTGPSIHERAGRSFLRNLIELACLRHREGKNSCTVPDG